LCLCATMGGEITREHYLVLVRHHGRYVVEDLAA